MRNKKIAFSLTLVLLLLICFWLGRVTERIGKNSETSHEKVPAAAAKSNNEAVLHSHEEGKTDNHHHEQEETTSLKLSPEEKANIGLKTVVADLRPIENVIRISGVVKPHPDKEAQVSSRVSGKIVGLYFKVGDAVQRGQRLAEIQSAEIQKLQVDLIQAENKLILHKAELDRIQKLVESKIAAQKELIAAQNQHQTDINEIEGLTQQLILLGLPENAVRKARAEKSVSTFAVLSPLNGVVAERGVVLGETVEPSKVLFKIFDFSVVFVEGDAFEEAVPQLKVGQEVRIRLAAYSGEVFAGRITRFSPVIDPQKRTIHLWVEVANRGGMLKPNLFADMDAVVGGKKEVLAIPSDALITTEGASFVFVEEDGAFRRADVVLGAKDDRFVEVKRGLLPGDRVVTLGKQEVYTKSLMAREGGATLGGHTH